MEARAALDLDSEAMSSSAKASEPDSMRFESESNLGCDDVFDPLAESFWVPGFEIFQKRIKCGPTAGLVKNACSEKPSSRLVHRFAARGHC